MKVLVVVSHLVVTCCLKLAVGEVWSCLDSTIPLKQINTIYKYSCMSGHCGCALLNDRVYVDCSSRGLKRVPRLYSKTPIVKIWLSRNSIRALEETFIQDIESLVQLEVIDLSCNPLQLQSGPMLKSNSLKTLWLNNCEVDNIGEDAFSHLPALENLNLQGNRITALSVEHFSRLVSLKSLMLDNNPLHCDCPLQRLREYCEQKAISTGFLPTCRNATGQSVPWPHITGYCPQTTQVSGVTLPQSTPQALWGGSCSALLPAVVASVVATAVMSLLVVGMVLLVRWRRHKQLYVASPH